MDREQKHLRQSTVSAFFAKVPKTSAGDIVVNVAESSSAVACDRSNENEHSDDSDSGMPTTPIVSSIYDVGLYLNVPSNAIDNGLKLRLLTDPWHPEPTFTFPAEGPRRLRFQMQWLSQNPWLVYSSHVGGALCKYCVLFAQEHEAGQGEGGKGSHQGLGAFVSKPFVKWTTAKEYFKRHSETEYHKTCVSLAEHFAGVTKDSAQILY